MDEPLSQRDTGSKRPRTTNEAAEHNRQVRNRDIDNDLRALKQAVDDVKAANAGLKESFVAAQEESHSLAMVSYHRIAANQNEMNDFLHGTLAAALAANRADMAAAQKALDELKKQAEHACGALSAAGAQADAREQADHDMAKYQEEWTQTLRNVGVSIDDHNRQIEECNRRLEALDARFSEMAERFPSQDSSEKQRRDMENGMNHSLPPSALFGLQQADLSKSMARTIEEFDSKMEDMLQKVASVAMNIEDLFEKKQAEAEGLPDGDGQAEREPQDSRRDLRIDILILLASAATAASAACLFLLLA